MATAVAKPTILIPDVSVASARQRTRSIKSPSAVVAPAMPPILTPLERLHAAVLADDIFAMPELIAAANVNAADSVGRTPLLLAAVRGNTRMMALLLAHGANPALRTRHGERLAEEASTSPINTDREGTVLHWAVYHNQLAAVRMLLAQPSCRAQCFYPCVTQWQETLLHTAARRGTARLVTLLCLYKDLRTVRIRDQQEHTPAEVANCAESRAVLAAGTGIMMGQAYADITSAVRMRNIFDAMKIIERDASGAQTQVPDSVGMLPLDVAVVSNDLDMVMALLSANAAPLYSTNTPGSTCALVRAFATPTVQQPILELLLSRVTSGLAKAALSKNGDTVMHSICRDASTQLAGMALMLPDAISMLSTKNNQGQRPACFLNDAHLRSIFEAALCRAMGGKLPEPLPPAVICAICLMPPASGELAYSCACRAGVCTPCLIFQAESALNSGAIPCCSSTGCNVPIARRVLFNLLARERSVTMMSLVANQHSRLDAHSRVVCPVCNRINDMDTMSHSPHSIMSCAHCCVNFCTVCHTIAPQSAHTMGEDTDFHAKCQEKFRLVMAYSRFCTLLHEGATRSCNSCGERGVKDNACNHITCGRAGCQKNFCYVCGVSPSSHNGAWQTVVTECPQYLYYLKDHDQRILAQRCTNASCTSCTTCNQKRDNHAQQILASMRVRAHILAFAESVGRTTFLEMTALYNQRETIDALYFAPGGFPWNAPVDEPLPTWDSFEPEDCRAFYAARPHWLTIPTKLTIKVPSAGASAAAGSVAGAGAAAPAVMIPPPPPMPAAAVRIAPGAEARVAAAAAALVAPAPVSNAVLLNNFIRVSPAATTTTAAAASPLGAPTVPGSPAVSAASVVPPTPAATPTAASGSGVPPPPPPPVDAGFLLRLLGRN